MSLLSLRLLPLYLRQSERCDTWCQQNPDTGQGILALAFQDVAIREQSSIPWVKKNVFCQEPTDLHSVSAGPYLTCRLSPLCSLWPGGSKAFSSPPHPPTQISLSKCSIFLVRLFELSVWMTVFTAVHLVTGVYVNLCFMSYAVQESRDAFIFI